MSGVELVAAAGADEAEPGGGDLLADLFGPAGALGFPAQVLQCPLLADDLAGLFKDVVKLLHSGKKKSTVALLVLTERKTRNENIIVVPDRRAETTVRAINALERKLGAEKFGIIYKSITVDNGSEFALADQLEQSCITGDKRTKVYYCHPYSSWERGSNENVNGMIRRRHPKGTDFSKVTAEEIAATENWINSYPRKIFGYKSAGTMFRECLRELGLTA